MVRAKRLRTCLCLSPSLIDTARHSWLRGRHDTRRALSSCIIGIRP